MGNVDPVDACLLTKSTKVLDPLLSLDGFVPTVKELLQLHSHRNFDELSRGFLHFLQLLQNFACIKMRSLLGLEAIDLVRSLVPITLAIVLASSSLITKCEVGIFQLDEDSSILLFLFGTEP